MSTPPPDSLRARLFISGELIEEVWLTSGPATEGIAARHQQLTLAAEREGTPWLIELYDPDEPEERAFLRYGTDTSMMTAPVGLLIEHLPDYLKGER